MFPKNDKAKKLKIDYILLTTIFFLMSIGTVMVYSSSYYFMLYTNASEPRSYLYSNLFYSAIGIGMLVFILLFTNYKWLKKGWIVVILLIVTVAMLIYVNRFTVAVKGATRWIKIMGISVMPSEIAKLTVALTIAYYYNKVKNSKSFKFYCIMILFLGMMSFMIYKLTDDFSTALVVAASGIGTLYVLGSNFFYILSTSVLAILSAVFFIIRNSGMRSGRVAAFKDIFATKTYEFNPDAYQSMYSIYSIAEGGVYGVGLGAGMVKVRLPEPYNDFILSTIAEEFGLIGVLIVVLLFMVAIFRIFRIANYTNDKFAYAFTLMTGFYISFQTLINMYVVYNLVPVTGITLPFISRGGSSLIIMLFLVSVVLNISSQTEF